MFWERFFVEFLICVWLTHISKTQQKIFLKTFNFELEVKLHNLIYSKNEELACPRGYKCFMLNSAECVIFSANKYENANKRYY